MRIYKRDAFLKLPAGTLYCQGQPWAFESMCFKGETLPAPDGDWYGLDPAWVDGHDSGECFDRLEKMLADGESFPMQDSECRDGRFDQDAIFLVFEKADLLKLREWIDNAIVASE